MTGITGDGPLHNKPAPKRRVRERVSDRLPEKLPRPRKPENLRLPRRRSTGDGGGSDDGSHEDFGAGRVASDRRIPAEVQDLAVTFGKRIGPMLLQEVKGAPKGRKQTQEAINRVIAGSGDAIGDLQPALYALAVKYPMDGEKLHRRGEAVAFTTAVAASVADDAAMLASPMSGIAMSMCTQLVAELIETWVAAATRAAAYERAGLVATPELLALDIAEWSGFPTAGAAGKGSVKKYLVNRYLHRTRRRLTRGLIPVAGALANGATAVNGLRKLNQYPLRPEAARRQFIEGELVSPMFGLPAGDPYDIVFDDPLDDD
jgi:hypothetical protein